MDFKCHAYWAQNYFLSMTFTVLDKFRLNLRDFDVPQKKKRSYNFQKNGFNCNFNFQSSQSHIYHLP